MITDNSQLTETDATELAKAIREKTGLPFSGEGKGVLFAPYESPSVLFCQVALTDEGDEQWQAQEGEEDSEPWDFVVREEQLACWGSDAVIFAILAELAPS